jgi:competence protein ComFC
MLLGYRFYKSVWVVIDWVFPPYCASCQKSGHRWCEDCKKKTSRVSIHECAYCGRPLSDNFCCTRCTSSNGRLDQIFIWGNHEGPLRKALHKLKYKRDLGLGDELSTFLIGIMKDNEIPGDLVVPVPLSTQRFRERGYNQAALLARPIAMALRIPYRPRALKRIRETRSQVGLSITQRQKNVEGAFSADPALVAGKSVILVDDVMTTGATINEAGKALKQAGADWVAGLILAKAVKTFV